MKGQFCFIDLETTGLSPDRDRIIEIGALKVKDGKIIDTYHTLVNPQRELPYFITKITGLAQGDLQGNPEFSEVSSSLLGFLGDSLFIAHNANFDYGFIRAELAREGVSFNKDYCCSVKVSRQLYPEHRRHGLDKIINRFGFEVTNRHRAVDDARVIYDFFKQAHKAFGQQALNGAIIKATTSLKVKGGPLQTSHLPGSPGVYIFRDINNYPLYIGKSINIRKRVSSHFAASAARFAGRAKSIDYIGTAGELGALIKESQLIKKFCPMYNRQLKRSRGIVVLRQSLNDAGYIQLSTEEVDEIPVDQLESFVGVYRSKKQLQSMLTRLAKAHGLCSRLLGLESGNRSCFNHQMGICSGACVGREPREEYNSRLLQVFDEYRVINWPYSGPVVYNYSRGIERDVYLIDQWCILGSRDSEKSKAIPSYKFDYDIYKILRRYLGTDQGELLEFSNLEPALTTLKNLVDKSNA